MDITVERPVHTQCEELHALFECVIRHAFVANGIPECHHAEIDQQVSHLNDFLARDFATDGRGEHFLIAQSEDRIVGTIAYGRPNDVILSRLDIDAVTTPEIKSAYILPDFQGQGIGSLLFDAILERLRDRQFTGFCLDCGFPIAQKFWTRKLGEPTAILNDFFGPGAHHLIWLRTVENPASQK